MVRPVMPPLPICGTQRPTGHRPRERRAEAAGQGTACLVRFRSAVLRPGLLPHAWGTKMWADAGSTAETSMKSQVHL